MVNCAKIYNVKSWWLKVKKGKGKEKKRKVKLLPWHHRQWRRAKGLKTTLNFSESKCDIFLRKGKKKSATVSALLLLDNVADWQAPGSVAVCPCLHHHPKFRRSELSNGTTAIFERARLARRQDGGCPTTAKSEGPRSGWCRSSQHDGRQAPGPGPMHVRQVRPYRT
jgi:hypothetical protein